MRERLPNSQDQSWNRNLSLQYRLLQASPDSGKTNEIPAAASRTDEALECSSQFAAPAVLFFEVALKGPLVRLMDLIHVKRSKPQQEVMK